MKLAPRLTKTLIQLLLTCLLIVLMLRWFEHSQVYHPDRVLTATGAELGRPFEDVRFKASDGVELNGWFFPASTNDSPRAQFALLLCHGNAGNISHRLDTCAALLATGASVFVFDYRGYGRSAGRPSEEGTYRDAQAAYQWLRQKGFAGTNIIAFGESLGGGVAAELAVRKRSAGWCCKARSRVSRTWAQSYSPGCRCAGSARYATTRIASCHASRCLCW